MALGAEPLRLSRRCASAPGRHTRPGGIVLLVRAPGGQAGRAELSRL